MPAAHFYLMVCSNRCPFSNTFNRTFIQ